MDGLPAEKCVYWRDPERIIINDIYTIADASVPRDIWESLTLLGMEVSWLVEMGSQQMDLGRNHAKVTNICTWRKPWELDFNGETQKMNSRLQPTMSTWALAWSSANTKLWKSSCYTPSIPILFTHIWDEGKLNSDVGIFFPRRRKHYRNQLNFQDELAKRMDSVESHVTSMVITTFNDILSNTTCLSCPKSPARQLGGIFNRSLYLYGKESPCWEVFWSC